MPDDANSEAYDTTADVWECQVDLTGRKRFAKYRNRHGSFVPSANVSPLRHHWLRRQRWTDAKRGYLGETLSGDGRTNEDECGKVGCVNRQSYRSIYIKFSRYGWRLDYPEQDGCGWFEEKD